MEHQDKTSRMLELVEQWLQRPKPERICQATKRQTGDLCLLGKKIQAASTTNEWLCKDGTWQYAVGIKIG